MKGVTVRFDDDAVFERVKDKYARTYSKHRLSFNAWIIECLQCDCTPKPKGAR